jgi:hypothetical protein
MGRALAVETPDERWTPRHRGPVADPCNNN